MRFGTADQFQEAIAGWYKFLFHQTILGGIEGRLYEIYY